MRDGKKEGNGEAAKSRSLGNWVLGSWTEKDSTFCCGSGGCLLSDLN